MNKPEYLVEVRDLKQHFPIKTGMFSTTPLKAVDGVSFTIKPGETLGLVGESGCGKSTIAKLIVQLEKPSEGKILFHNQDLSTLNKEDKHKNKTKIQMIFQDPYSSLNPRKTIGDAIKDPML